MNPVVPCSVSSFRGMQKCTPRVVLTLDATWHIWSVICLGEVIRMLSAEISRTWQLCSVGRDCTLTALFDEHRKM